MNKLSKNKMIIASAVTIFILGLFSKDLLATISAKKMLLDRAYGRFEVLNDSIGFILESPKSIRKFSIQSSEIDESIKIIEMIDLEVVKMKIRNVYCGYEFIKGKLKMEYSEFTLENFDLIGSKMYIPCYVTMPIKRPVFFNKKIYVNNISFAKFLVIVVYNIEKGKVERINIEYDDLTVDEIGPLHGLGFTMLDTTTYAAYNMQEDYSVLVYKLTKDGLYRLIRASKEANYEMSLKNNIPQIISKTYPLNLYQYKVICGSKIIDFDLNVDNSTQLVKLKKNEVVFKYYKRGTEGNDITLAINRSRKGFVLYTQQNLTVDWSKVLNATFGDKYLYVIKLLKSDEYQLEIIPIN